MGDDLGNEKMTLSLFYLLESISEKETIQADTSQAQPDPSANPVTIESCTCSECLKSMKALRDLEQRLIWPNQNIKIVSDLISTLCLSRNESKLLIEKVIIRDYMYTLPLCVFV